METREQEPLIPFMDQVSEDFRRAAEMYAQMELKKRQKEDSRYNDPMTAYKAMEEIKMGWY